MTPINRNRRERLAPKIAALEALLDDVDLRVRALLVLSGAHLRDGEVRRFDGEP